MLHRCLLFDVALKLKFRRSEKCIYLLIERKELRQGNGIYIYIYIYIHTHTHTHTYIKTYMYICTY